MSEQTTTRWPRKTWDEYAAQVRDSMPTPDITPYARPPMTLTTVRYTCPLCLRDSVTLRIVHPEGAETFTATWESCGHAVHVTA